MWKAPDSKLTAFWSLWAKGTGDRFKTTVKGFLIIIFMMTVFAYALWGGWNYTFESTYLCIIEMVFQ